MRPSHATRWPITINTRLTRPLALLLLLLTASWTAGAAAEGAAAQLLSAAQRGDETQVVQLKAELESRPKPLRGDKKTARALNEEALKLLRSGEHSTAIERLTAASKADNGDAEVLGNLGYAFLMTQRFGDAKTALEKALDLAPTRSASWGNLGEAYAGLGNEPAAIAALRLAYHFSRNREKTIAYFTLLIEKPDAVPLLVSTAKTVREAPALAPTTDRTADAAKQPGERTNSAPDSNATTRPSRSGVTLDNGMPMATSIDKEQKARGPGNEVANDALLHAAAADDVQVIREALAMGGHISTRDKYGRTALMIASDNGADNVVRVLIEHGSEINGRDFAGNTPLILAATQGRDAVVRTLLAKGANVSDRANDGWPPILLAAQNGHTAVVQLLVEHGAELNDKPNEVSSACRMASHLDHRDIYKLLREKGARCPIEPETEADKAWVEARIQLGFEKHCEPNYWKKVSDCPRVQHPSWAPNLKRCKDAAREYAKGCRLVVRKVVLDAWRQDKKRLSGDVR